MKWRFLLTIFLVGCGQKTVSGEYRLTYLERCIYTAEKVYNQSGGVNKTVLKEKVDYQRAFDSIWYKGFKRVYISDKSFNFNRCDFMVDEIQYKSKK